AGRVPVTGPNPIRRPGPRHPPKGTLMSAIPQKPHHDSPLPSTWEGGCFCGAVQVEVTGEPVAMGYCHCESCRSWSGSPVNAFTLWKPENVRVTRGADKIVSYNKTPRSYRKWCKDCGGHLFAEHPHWNLIDVYAATIPAFP